MRITTHDYYKNDTRFTCIEAYDKPFGQHEQLVFNKTVVVTDDRVVFEFRGKILQMKLWTKTKHGWKTCKNVTQLKELIINNEEIENMSHNMLTCLMREVNIINEI